MKKQILFIVIIVFLIFSNLNFLVSANPLPEPPEKKKGFSPMVGEYNGSINFFSEEVTYTIYDKENVEVTAYYVFKNLKNETLEQNIMLPFVDIPKDLEIRKNGKKISYQENNYYLSLNGSHFNKVASFNLTFQGYETIIVSARYTLSDTISTEKESDYVRYSCSYLSETGRFWNDSIDATFTFKIKKDLYYTSDLEDYNVTKNENYVVVTKTYTNWVPDENVEISWKGPNDETTTEELLVCCGATIAVIVVIIVVIFLVVRKIKGDKNQQSYVKMQNYRKSCPFCSKTIPFDAKICPYCGKRV